MEEWPQKKLKVSAEAVYLDGNRSDRKVLGNVVGSIPLPSRSSENSIALLAANESVASRHEMPPDVSTFHRLEREREREIERKRD